MAGRAEPPGPEGSEARGERLRAVRVTDEPVPTVVRDPSDALGLVLCLLGVALTLFLASFAHGTTSGLSEDAQGLDHLLRQFVVVPAVILERVVALVAPLAVLAELLLRHAVRQAVMSFLAALAGVLVAAAAVEVLRRYGAESLVSGLSVSRDGAAELTVPVPVTMVCALLVVAGPRRRRRTVAWSWVALWATVTISLVTAQVALLGLVLALLLGGVAALAVRYVLGVPTARAYGDDLVDAARRAGLEPVEITRREGVGRHRRYAVRTEDGQVLELKVLDNDRQVVTLLTHLWETVRFREVGAPPLSVRETVEHLVALTALVRRAGVAAPGVHAVVEARDSTVLVQDPAGGAVPFAELGPDGLTDDVLRRLWADLVRVHGCGVAHRRLSARTVLLEAPEPGAGGPRAVEPGAGEPRAAEPGRVWFTGWESGAVAASDLLRRVDTAQVLTLLAVRVGVERALRSARDALPAREVTALAPLLQPVAMPPVTREELRGNREVLTELRAAVAPPGPVTEIEPVRLVRLGGRQALTAILAAVAVVVVLTTVNITEISDAVTAGDWRWSMGAFVIGLFTFVGTGATHVALAPVRLPLWLTVKVQVAAAFVTLAAPAGLGPAGLNVRMLVRRGVPSALALATIGLVQVSQFVITAVMIVVLTVLSGASVASIPTIGAQTLLIIAAVVAAVGAALLVRPLREGLARTVLPVLHQTWPLLVEVSGHPRRLALAALGNAVTTGAWILAFSASLAAFGEHRSVIQVALVYFASNAVGSVVPTPGGVGSVDVALIAGLSAIGVGAGVAVPAMVVFRLATFWSQIPLGWATLRHLMRRGDL